MSTSKSIQPIPVLAQYFDGETPIITEEFAPGKGWHRTNYNKRVSRSWLRKLKGEGITVVGLTVKGRSTADFSVAELLKVDRRPLLGGNVI